MNKESLSDAAWWHGFWSALPDLILLAMIFFGARAWFKWFKEQ